MTINYTVVFDIFGILIIASGAAIGIIIFWREMPEMYKKWRSEEKDKNGVR